MAGLTKLILPGSSRSAEDVDSDFNSLKSIVNDLKDDNLEPGAVNTRHLLDRALSSPTLPLKKVWRKEFTESAIASASYTELCRLGPLSGPFPRLYGEDTVVFVVADLQVYHSSATLTPMEPTTGNNDVYGVRLHFSQGVGPGVSWGSFSNTTDRYVTPGSASAFVNAEISQVVLFGVAPVSASSVYFNVRVTAKSFGMTGTSYDLSTNGSANGKISGSITALVIAR